ncbi:MAG: VWA domain-containing protein [Burkholderiales bacterium]
MASAKPISEPAAQIRGFASYLRDHGFLIGLAELDAMLHVSLLLDIGENRRLKTCWKGIVCSTGAQWRKYPELFDAYWYPHKVRGSSKTSGVERKGKTLRQLVQDMHASMEKPGANRTDASIGFDFESPGTDSAPSEKAQGGASRTDPLHKDFKQWLPEEIHQLESYIAPLEQRLKRKLTRHWRKSHLASRIDLPKSMRQGMSTGGEIIKLQMKKRSNILPRIYVLVDVSKSMEAHAQFFLRIARAFCQILNARVFVFHTRLAEISFLLKHNSGRMQEKINAVTFGFGGGTRIATNLEAFLKTYAKRTLGRKDIVYILSDGYDTDPPEQTRDAIHAIRNRGATIFWLHPTVAIPQSEAIALSREHISAFMSVDNLKSLEKLADLGRSKMFH